MPFCPYIAFCWLQCPDPTIGIGAFPHEFLGCLRLVTLTVRAVGLSAAADSWPSADAASHRGRAASYRASSDGAIRGADRQRFLGRPASPRPPGTVAIPQHPGHHLRDLARHLRQLTQHLRQLATQLPHLPELPEQRRDRLRTAHPRRGGGPRRCPSWPLGGCIGWRWVPGAVAAGGDPTQRGRGTIRPGDHG